MKVALLAGGLGTRLSELTATTPKPAVEVGSQPIIWHIMNIYAAHGFNEFVVALGYKGEVIKKYMTDYCALSSNLTVDFSTGTVEPHNGHKPNWRVDLIDTGAKTMTGGRVKRLAPYLGDGTFMMTYGDGVSDVNITKLLEFHRSHGKLATMTAVRPVARFGQLDIVGNRIENFAEKPQTREGWINGGFFVLEPEVLDYIDNDDTFWEKEPLERLAAAGQLMAYQHESFWQCMDTLRDKVLLDSLWESGNAPWKVWE